MPLVAHAQSYPTRSITVVVPFPAGSPSDVIARIVTERMGRTLGQQMVIENVGGAGGTLGSARVAASQPDGYVLLAGSMGSHVAAPVLTPNVKYDSERDFEPIGLTAHAPVVIVARKDFPAENLNEFVAYLKEAGINYQMSIWAGIFAPKGTPKEITAKLAAALDKALDDPSVRRRIAELGGSVPAKQERTPVSFARLVKAEITRWSPILKAASLTMN